MRLFAGLERSDYQHLLRAVGALHDEHGLRDVRLWEHVDGLVVQGRSAAGEGRFETYLLADEDLRGLLGTAYPRWGMPGQRRPGDGPPAT